MAMLSLRSRPLTCGSGCQAGRNHTVASGGSVSVTLVSLPWAGTSSGFSGSSLRTSLPPYRAASVFRISTQASGPPGTPSR